MRDLAYTEIVVGSDSHELVDAVMNPVKWPRCRALLQRVTTLCASIGSVAFETESVSSNKVVREIAKSVLRDGRFQSYLVGPAWLHQLIQMESSLCS